MPTSPLKRPSAGGRLGRLLASLRQPARAGGALPVQTGFPTSLADLVVKNHVRLKNPRRRHRPSAAPPSPAPPVAAESAAQEQQQRREVVLTVRDAAIRRPKGSAFRIRPEVLAVGGAVALALLVVWSKWLVAAATVASVALFGIESVRSSSASRCRPRRPETEGLVSCGRGRVSPIREEAESSEAGTPMSSSVDSDRGSEVSSLWTADTTHDLVGGAFDDSVFPKRKEKRRSLRKLIAKKLRNGKRSSKDKVADTCSVHGGESKHPEPVNADPPSPAPTVDTTPRDAITDERCRQRVAFPSGALVPIILVGLVAGKFPAVALTVLCAVFFSSVDNRVPATS